MSSLASEIEEELQYLEPETARQFERVVRDMLHLVKTQHAPKEKTTTTLADRLRHHPALGTWPPELDPDAHVDALRQEWEDRR
jgi:hypothetical protein